MLPRPARVRRHGHFSSFGSGGRGPRASGDARQTRALAFVGQTARCLVRYPARTSRAFSRAPSRTSLGTLPLRRGLSPCCLAMLSGLAQPGARTIGRLVIIEELVAFVVAVLRKSACAPRCRTAAAIYSRQCCCKYTPSGRQGLFVATSMTPFQCGLALHMPSWACLGLPTRIQPLTG
jgi:hypothetical protein